MTIACGECFGGFAAEYEGHADPEGASKVLHQDLEDMLAYKAESVGRVLVKVDPRGTWHQGPCGAHVPKT
jgi:hypothetical protein